MIGISVLLHLGTITGEALYFFTDDATNFFNQCLLARTEYHTCETIMLDYKKDALVMVAEYCMSFGISPASNIAQRLAILIVEVVKKNFDEEEERYAEECNHPGFQQWRQTRRMLSSKTGRNEARCYFLEMYTDEPLGGILGAQRMKRFIV